MNYDYFDECLGEDYVSPRNLLLSWMANHLGMTTYNEEYGCYEKENDYEY